MLAAFTTKITGTAAMFCHNIILMMMLRFKYDMSSHIM
ncbi:hypothetical protein LTSEWAN_2753 [Salmonella enterica subsp. enterica serovar Wandsworth str. A4-580]|uniref:Uncharacterized protein n=1 Tax=Salmonella enterica subsp. enterica serovar Wandsworth str. A4-580 TaxID=913086 RepID=G5SC10_SALET|nr:hypothetical protein LTSEWAN_2753 [Salmonella enterica subsp. enterica serovar Wandsworth str. A4-580]